jgi:hypothetical protein
METKKSILQVWILLWHCILLSPQVWSQPFVDPLQMRYTYGFRNTNAEATPHTHLWIGCDLPVKLKENMYLVFSPTYEQWQIDSADTEKLFPVVRSFSFPVGLLVPFKQSKWSLTLLPVLRSNGEKLFGENTLQFGGATLVTYARKPKQKFRLGLYVNNEFFGLYFVPLLGTDWRIDEKNYLFGVLPGRLTFEHQWSEKWYGGITFRAITNSYRFSNGQFMRLDDNQVSLFMDYYLTKHICVTLEPGYGLLRKLRTGENKEEYLREVEWGDGPFIKLSSSYRIRL